MTGDVARISDVVALLQKVTQTAGDLPVMLRDIEHNVVTELRHIGVTLSVGGGPAGGCVTLAHAPAVNTSAASVAATAEVGGAGE